MSSSNLGDAGDDRSVTPRPENGRAGGRPSGGPLVHGLEAVRRVIDRILLVVCVVIFVALVAVVTWQVFTRQVMDDPATWTTETAQYTFVILAVLGAALVFSERGHIAVEILAHKFSEPLQRVVALFVEAMIMFFAVYILIYGGYAAAQNAWNQNISTMPFTIGQLYMVLPVAGVLITFFSLCHVIGMFAGTEELMPEIDESNQGI